MSNRRLAITPDLLLRAYAQGIFPMADEAGVLRWYDPPIRALIPLDDRFHVPRRLARTLRRTQYQLSWDNCFEQVVRLCASPAPDRPTTWISDEIMQLYLALHHRGYAHSLELWDQNDLIGGLYGVTLGGAFFGESMVSRKRDASKIVLVHLVRQLRAAGYALLDTQFQTDHLQQFGTFEITRSHYQHLLAEALTIKPKALSLSAES